MHGEKKSERQEGKIKETKYSYHMLACFQFTAQEVLLTLVTAFLEN
jgi:hypothetical protein